MNFLEKKNFLFRNLIKINFKNSVFYFIQKTDLLKICIHFRSYIQNIQVVDHYFEWSNFSEYNHVLESSSALRHRLSYKAAPNLYLTISISQFHCLILPSETLFAEGSDFDYLIFSKKININTFFSN